MDITLCMAENICFSPDDVEVEVVCDLDSGHEDDHQDNEQGYSWKREED